MMWKSELKNWKLCGYYPYAPIKETSMELGIQLKGQTRWMDAEVPSNVYCELQKAGYIEDPYYAMNSLKCEWVPERWWVYLTHFDVPEQLSGRLKLRFDGICYRARIFVNDQQTAVSENAFVPLEIDVTDLVRAGKNKLHVILEHKPDEYGQIGLTCDTFTQKPRFDYKWDFSARMVNVGLVGKVALYDRPEAEIESFHFNPENLAGGKVKVLLSLNSRIDTDAEIFVRLEDGTRSVASGRSSVHLLQGENQAVAELDCGTVELWYPNGSGGQKLYWLVLELTVRGLTDRVDQQVGFKQLKLEKNPGADENALPYVFVVNGKQTYIKGANMVPLDLMIGTQTRARYDSLLRQLRDLNVNLVRVWGGGVIESEDFYELCAIYGIMVWQDFIQSSSGIDNYPSHRPEFLENFKRTCTYAAKTRRNYVSLAVFCGGNELMNSDWTPVDFSCENVGEAQKIVNTYCPIVPIFPSTPSGPRFTPGVQEPNKNHDVHGEWTYQGVRRHYEWYNGMKSLFHSEFGVDGLANPESVEKFMPKEILGVVNTDEDDVWRHKGEWWNCYKRDIAIFGSRMKSFEDFADCSQLMQYEGIRYILEHDRRNAFYNSGSILWQANEPWPNICCSNIIDYYGVEKPACVGVRCAYGKVVPSFRYDQFLWNVGENAEAELFLISELFGANITVRLEVFVDDVRILQKCYEHSGETLCTSLEKVAFRIPDCKSVRLRAVAETEGKVYENEVYWAVCQEDGFAAVEPVRKFVEKLRGLT